MSVKSLIFDLDGTLCPSKKRVLPEIEQALIELSESHDLWIVTGATYDQIKAQVTEPLLSKFTGVYSCLGTQCYDSQGNKTFECTAEFPKSLYCDLENLYMSCEFPEKVEATITDRQAMLNYCVIGAEQTDELRAKFSEWDKQHRYREHVIDIMSQCYPDYEFAAGGMVSIDITQKGFDKSLILKNPDLKDDVLFFGDKCEPGGNDYPLVKAIEEQERGGSFNVFLPEGTLKLLRTLLKKIRG